MITLITGAPGAGKTAALVDLLRELVTDRPLYVHGLEGLQLQHEVVDASRWHELLPDGAVLVIDEVQQVWRPRGPSVRPGADVQALETHRHRGIDIYLTTQQPKLLDANVRALVGRHIHIRDTGWLGRWWYEWPECSDALAWKTCPIKKRYKLPRKAFDLYKSASMHIKPKRGGSPMLWITGVLVVAFIVLAVMVYRSISAKFAPAEEPVQSAPVDVPKRVPRAGESVTASLLTPAGMVAARVPRLPAEPESAPVYDELRHVRVMPRVIGGYCEGDRCRCFTQQGTDPGLTSAQCRDWMARPPFDMYRELERRDGDRRGERRTTDRSREGDLRVFDVARVGEGQ